MSKRTDSPGLGSLGSGALTAASMLVVSGMAAVVGVVIAREFGRTEETDGLLAAYGVFIVIAIAAQAIRVTVLPQLARAQEDGRLAAEIVGCALALAVICAPLVLLAELAAEPVARLLTSGESVVARDTAAQALRWMVPAATAHLFAALAASGLAAVDDYGTAALGYALGSTAGLTLIVARVEEDGIVAVSWGMALNGTIALLVPVAGLAVHAVRSRMPSGAVRPNGPPLGARLGVFAVGAALPLALQALYVVCLPFAARLGTGAATSFVYAYLAAAALVAVTASSLGLVTSVPLTRAGMSAERAARHVVASSWLSLVLIGAASGAFALAGADVVEGVLGETYGGDVGSELGRLVVVLSPWMVVAVGVTVTFPLAFVADRTRVLPWIAVTALALQVGLAWLGARVLELDGLAIGLAVSTLLVLAGLLRELGAFAGAARGLAGAAFVVALLTLAAFVPAGILLADATAAAVGLAAYGCLLAAVRPPGLRAAWRYLRALG